VQKLMQLVASLSGASF